MFTGGSGLFEEAQCLVEGAKDREPFEGIGPREAVWEEPLGVHEQGAIRALKEARRAAEAWPVGQPSGTRASVIPPDDPFWAEYPGFQSSFEAGRMFDHPERWAESFAEENVHLRAYDCHVTDEDIAAAQAGHLSVGGSAAMVRAQVYPVRVDVAIGSKSRSAAMVRTEVYTVRVLPRTAACRAGSVWLPARQQWRFTQDCARHFRALW